MTAKGETGSAMRWVVVALIAIVSAGAVAFGLTTLLAPSGRGIGDALAAAPLATVAALASPFVAAWLGAVALRSAAAATVPLAETPAAPVSEARRAAPAGAAALQLLALLQQEGRFVDFIQEDLTPHTDEQIGAAVRSIHEGCRSALRDRVELRPVLAGVEGATVSVERGFDPAAVRVIGNVRGEPPYRGVLRHPGWRSDRVQLPEQTGDASILAPAEVEVL
ncbi:MAG: DUF2760 domain-containing protein [Deltaproteobacteria bacterium]|nr:DUF2760 domain-containing protein [Deltaproteobacteria bacterium]